MSEQLARLTAVYFYLNELQKHNLITPSISRPYPRGPMNTEKLIYHKSHRKIQQLRIQSVKDDIAALQETHTQICMKTLRLKKQKFRRKLLFLVQKYKPDPVAGKDKIERKHQINSTLRNRKSRERYQVRKYKKQIGIYNNHPDRRTVFNLSNTELSLTDTLALELGFGFVPTPCNTNIEEEILLLEGFRFVDRIGNVDSKLSEIKNKIQQSKSDESTSAAANDFSQATSSYGEMFEREKHIPASLRFSQPKEVDLTNNETKTIKKEFQELNSKLLNNIKSRPQRKYNLPKKLRDSIQNLRKFVRDKVLDIRKVDKGQVILVTDYCQRKKTEELNISKVAKLCEAQSSNWMENKLFVETKMKELFVQRFASKDELASVTGLLAGGASGKLKNKDGSMKYTRAVASSELFAKQSTPYVYPLFKVHKLSIEQLMKVHPDLVYQDIPSRLVIGMKNCQLRRVQIWLEHFLTPLAKIYCSFEYIKDSSEFLCELEDIKVVADHNHWDWTDYILFSVDVKSLYPSVKFEHLVKALKHCFEKCTNWNQNTIDLIIEIIMYTLKEQQIYWNGSYYLLNQGIPTGGNHSVPLANILIRFILFDAFDSIDFYDLYVANIKLWKRFIDDCCGIYKGSLEQFLCWYRLLENQFNKFDLELTFDTDVYEIVDGIPTEKQVKMITFLDVEVFKSNGTLHTKEHRKVTSANSYLRIGSAHPKHTFPGIVKSQLNRLRRLCSKQSDFEEAVNSLESRCLNSGYDPKMVTDILNQAPNLTRSLVISPSKDSDTMNIRLIALAGTAYEHEFSKFANRLNGLFSTSGIHIEIVKSTSSSISQLLFNNRDKSDIHNQCQGTGCIICDNNIKNVSGSIKSCTTELSYKIPNNITCNNGGIYVVNGACSRQYTGKTTCFGSRANEHFYKIKSSTIYTHKEQCNICKDVKDFSITFTEDYLNRGKYSLSERELLWNHRIKGNLNIQKTLKS